MRFGPWPGAVEQARADFAALQADENSTSCRGRGPDVADTPSQDGTQVHDRRFPGGARGRMGTVAALGEQVS